MATIREVIDRLEANKQERKILKETIAQALEANGPWVKARDEVREEKARLKQIEMRVLTDYAGEVEQLEKLNLEIKNDNEVLSDMALTLFMKGENIEIENKGKKWKPEIKVLFKQMSLL